MVVSQVNYTVSIPSADSCILFLRVTTSIVIYLLYKNSEHTIKWWKIFWPKFENLNGQIAVCT